MPFDVHLQFAAEKQRTSSGSSRTLTINFPEMMSMTMMMMMMMAKKMTIMMMITDDWG